MLALGAPHDRYAARLRLGWVAHGPAADRWLESAAESLRTPQPVGLPWRSRVNFPSGSPRAAAFLLSLRRGQRLVVDPAAVHGAPSVFVDVFRPGRPALARVGDAAGIDPRLDLEIRQDGDYIVRVQPALGPDLALAIEQRTYPTLRLPVEGASVASIRSGFGAPRDGGRREHAGIDIFARRGTPVIAAADGIVSSVGTNRLGGNVVWVLRASHGEAHYYAHLDTQIARVGDRVAAGDVLGTVGNTGNARTTPPHLHFGIYAAGGAVDPLPYVADVPAAGGRQSARAYMISAEEDP
jgi:murein DD-endopeptidase MepM/ murein hydrolase activator NlpD